jgi:hypothetical protein
MNPRLALLFAGLVLGGCTTLEAGSGGTAAARDGALVSSRDECPAGSRGRTTYAWQDGHFTWAGWTCERVQHN